MFGRNREYVGSTIRTVLGIRGEPSTPDDPAQGLVWSSIVRLVTQTGEQNEFVSSGDSDRALFHKHPWSIGGGGASELKQRLEENSLRKLGQIVDSIGFFQDTHADDAFVLPSGFPSRHGIQSAFRTQIRGDNVRDWGAISEEAIFFPYTRNLVQWSAVPKEPCWSWLHGLRTELWSRSTFGGGTYRTSGRPWFDYHQFPKDRARTPQMISFAFVSTHNHFFYNRDDVVFNRSSPVIKLPADSSDEIHFGILSLLNSSIACFWMQQTMHNKGGPGGGCSKDEKWHDFFEFSGTR